MTELEQKPKIEKTSIAVKVQKVTDFLVTKESEIKKTVTISGYIFGSILLLSFSHFLKQILLLSDLLILIGFVYSVHIGFTNLLMSNTRKDLFQKINKFKQNVKGGK